MPERTTEELMQDLPPRMLQAAVILHSAGMFDQKRLDLLRACIRNEMDPVDNALHWVKLSKALRSRSGS